jgi:16S rRNA processing protein RimM
LVVGVVGRAVGLKGEVEVLVTSDAPDRFATGAEVVSGARALVVRSARTQRGRTVVAFDGIDDRAGAEALRGAELVIPAQAARELEADEYWDHDLIGCVVETMDGEEVGRVTDVLHQPSTSVLVVLGEREYLVPLIRDVVRAVEPRRRIAIEPIPGLLD